MSIDTLDTNLLASGKKNKSPDTPPAPPSRKHKILKYLAYVWIFFAALLFFFYLKTPPSLIEGLVLNSLNSQGGMRWQAQKISAHFFLLPHLKAEKLSMEPLRPGSLPPLFFEELELYPSLLSIITMNPSLSFEGSAYGSAFSGSASSGGPKLELDLTNLDLTKLTPLVEAGIDLRGVLGSLKTDLSLVNNRLSRASGTITAEGKNLVVDPSSFQIPMALPILDLGGMNLKATATNGKLNIEQLNLGSAGKDLELKVMGEVQLVDNVAFSRANLRVRIKPSQKILTVMPALKTMLGTLGATQADGFYAMKFSGTLANLGLPQPDR